jgi:hypothetical protein
MEAPMRLRIPLWMALAACLGCIALGRVVAQAPEPQKPGGEEPLTLTEYPYLPAKYGEPYIPSVAEWQAIRLTSLGASTTRITNEFSRQHLTCFPTGKGLQLTLDLLPQPSWKFSAPGGKFTAPVEKVKPDIEKAATLTIRFVRNFFSEVRDKDLTMRVFINSEGVGVWEDGKLTLYAERPFPSEK